LSGGAARPDSASDVVFWYTDATFQKEAAVLNRGTISFYVGAVLLLISAYRFYNQPTPPSGDVFYAIYTALHGKNRNPAPAPPWQGTNCFIVSREVDGYFYILDCIDAYPSVTQVRVRIRPGGDAVSGVDPTKRLKNMLLSVAGSDFPCTSRITAGQIEMQALLTCPQVAGSIGEISLTENHGNNLDTLRFTLANFLADADVKPSTGPNVWAITALAGFGLVILGLLANPLARVRSRAFADLKWLKVERQSLPHASGGSGAEMGHLLGRFEDTLFEIHRAEYEAILGSPESKAVGIVVVVLFGAVLILIYGIALGSGHLPVVGQVFGNGIPAPSTISARLDALDAAKGQRALILTSLALAGTCAIGLNWVLCALRVRKMARLIIQKRLARYRRQFEIANLSSWEPFEATLTSQEGQVRSKNAAYAESVKQAQDQSFTFHTQLSDAQANALAEITYGMQRTAKQLRKEFKRACKDALKATI
jgi:hypothetical protein